MELKNKSINDTLEMLLIIFFVEYDIYIYI